jgi:uncharacterized alpha-E superfamily protein
LADTSAQLAAMTGAQTDRMTRDDGWRLLSIGRHVERLGFLAGSLATGLSSTALHTEGGFDAMLALFDSTITFRAQFQQSHDLVALLDLLVMDRDNPRALGWVLQTLRGRLAKLGGSAPGVLGGLALQVTDPSTWDLEQLSQPAADGQHEMLATLLQTCCTCACQVSDDISATYFTHSGQAKKTGGA